MRFVSLFAGIGGFDLGLERAGMTCVGQCEIDPHARAVLERHWPDVPKHDDVTTLDGMHFGPADVVTFGSPCQDLSVAGKRAGLDGERSGLFLEAVRYIREMLRETNGRSPRFAVWENVPGAYSSNGGRDFAAVLQALVGGDVRCPANGWANAGVAFGPLGALEWRTLDSQHFGVAQRRRRVFVVYRPGGERAGEVLLEPAGVPRHPPSRRSPGAGITGALTGGASSSSAGNVDDNRAQAGFVVPVLGISQELDAEAELIGTLKRDSPTGGGSRPMVAVAPTVTASWGHHGRSSPRGDGTDPIVPVAFALRGRDDGAVPEVSGDKASALRGAAGGSSRDMVAYAFAENSRAELRLEGGDGTRTGALSTGGGKPGQGTPVIAYAATDYSTGSFAQTEYAGPFTATEDRSRAGIILDAQSLQPGADGRVRHDADAPETHARTLLRSLRETLGAEAYGEWAAGVTTALQPSPVLRPRVHEGSLPSEAEEAGLELDDRSPSRPEPETARAMRALREAERLGRTPQERRLAGQLARELGEALSLLPQPGASPEGGLFDLREAGQGLRVLRQALSAVQEVGRPADGETEPAHAGRANDRVGVLPDALEGGDASGSGRPTYAVRRLTPRCFRECERLQGFPDDHTRYDHHGREIADTHRYRMLGNAVTVSVANWIAHRIRQAA